MKNKFISVVLSLTIALTMVSTGVFATEDTEENSSEVVTSQNESVETDSSSADTNTAEDSNTIIPTVIDPIFTDVQDSSKYYYVPVYWAVSHSITGGTSETTFTPSQGCTRAQIVTFLWAAAGRPEVNTSNPFTDISSSNYYYKAVLWAVNKGITTGTTSTTFSPKKVCTRAQAMTFIWKYLGSPSVNTSLKFKDISSDKYYCNAVKWAVANGVTGGTTATTFSPNNTCTRAQIVTFLYNGLLDKANASDLADESPAGKVTISEINGSAGTFKITASGVTTASGVMSVSVPVWSASDKSDINWYKLTKTSDGVYEATGNISNHLYNFGTYNYELYIFSGSENKINVDSGTFSIAANNYLSASDAGSKKFTLKLQGASTSSVQFKVWSSANGTDDVIWYSGTASGSTVTATIDCTKHLSGGTFNAEAYASDKTTKLASTTFEVPTSYCMSEIEYEIYQECEKIYAKYGRDLKSCFNYSASLPYYRATPEPQTGYTNSQWYALYGFKNGKGHCYVHAATFYWLAKNLGYEVYYLQGYVPSASGGMVTHGWTEIIINGTTYVCDPNFTNETGKNGYMIYYGKSGTWRYTSYQRMS